jgi:hypothetical protein
MICPSFSQHRAQNAACAQVHSSHIGGGRGGTPAQGTKKLKTSAPYVPQDQQVQMDPNAGGGGMADMDDSMPMAMPMAMDLTLKCTCRVGKLFVSAWDIQTCGAYSASLAFIALFCFLRHLLTMHKTKLILRLAERDAGTQL